MKHLLLEPDFQAWREAAREALRLGYRPEEIDLQDATVSTTLALALTEDEGPTGAKVHAPHTSQAFLESARYAAVHRDPQRWNVLYRVLYRMQAERRLLRRETDADVDQMLRMEGQVRRDLQRMESFLRFRKVLEPGAVSDPTGRPMVVDETVMVDDGGRQMGEEHHLVLATPTPFGMTKQEIGECWPEIDARTQEVTESCDHFIAWYQPDHRILPLAAPFFAKRYVVLRWSILTPDAAVSWDPVTKRLIFSAGLSREMTPTEEQLEELWRMYFANVYHPKRVDPETMQERFIPGRLKDRVGRLR